MASSSSTVPCGSPPKRMCRSPWTVTSWTTGPATTPSTQLRLSSTLEILAKPRTSRLAPRRRHPGGRRLSEPAGLDDGLEVGEEFGPAAAEVAFAADGLHHRAAGFEPAVGDGELHGRAVGFQLEGHLRTRLLEVFGQ